jgi:hypothetical protein
VALYVAVGEGASQDMGQRVLDGLGQGLTDRF